MKLSVIITTKNRPQKLRACLVSILRSTYKEYEILVIDQRWNDENLNVVKVLASRRIRYHHIDRGVQTIALNTAQQMATGEVSVITDDDCTVPRTWLATIAKTYKKFPFISGLSGQILPNQKTKPGRGYVCAGLFLSEGERLITSVGPTVHSPESGFGKGANMSFRKEVFEALGGFKEWLGPGALGAGSESEFVYRAIKSKFKLYFLSSLVVYHNHWLTKAESLRVLSTKIPGYTAFISYHMIKNLDFSLYDGLFRFKWLLFPVIRAGIRWLFMGKSSLAPDHAHALRMICGITKGITMGAFFALRDLLLVFVRGRWVYVALRNFRAAN